MRKKTKIVLVSGTAVLIAAAFAGADAEKKNVSPKYSDVQSKFEACKNVSFVDGAEYKKNKAYWDEAMKTCGKPGEIQVLSEAGFFDSQIYDATRSVAFLQNVGEKVTTAIEANIKAWEKKLECYPYDKVKTPECDSVRKEILSQVHAVQPQLRQELAKAEGNVPWILGEMAGVGEYTVPPTKDRINASLQKGGMGKFGLEKTLDGSLVEKGLKKVGLEGLTKFGTMGVIRATDIEPMSDKEAKTAAEEFQKESDAALKGIDPTDARMFSEYKKLQFQHKMKYLELLQQQPLLAYLGKANPGHVEVEKAIKKMIEDSRSGLKKQKEILLEGKLSVNKGSDGGNKKKDKAAQAGSKDLLDFIVNERAVEEELKKDPALCGIATGLAKYKQDQMMTEAAEALGVPLAIVAVATGGSALAGMGGAAAAIAAGLEVGMVAAGPPLGWYFLNKSSSELKSNMAKMSAGTGTAAEADQAESGVVMSATFHPLDFLGMGQAPKMAGKAAGKVLNMSGAAKKMLVSEGMSEQEAEQLIKLSNSKTSKGVADNAQAKINQVALKKIFGRAPEKEEAEMLDAAAQVGMANKASIEDLVGTLNRLTAREDRIARAKQVTEYLKKINKERFKQATEKNRQDSLRTIMAASELFEGRDSGFIASHIVSTWDQGIEGVGRAYSRAARLMKEDKELLKIADMTERQTTAFQKALLPMINESKAYKDLPQADKDQLVKQLTVCGMGVLRK